MQGNRQGLEGFPPEFTHESVREMREARRANDDWLDRHFDELVGAHEGSWVAVDQGRTAFADSLEGLVAIAVAAGLRRRAMVIGHLRYINGAVAL